MPPINNSQETLHEILRLTRENNQMLHRMHRNAFLGGLFKFIVYAILFAAPIWFYMTYVSSSVDNLLSAVNKIQGTTSAAQSKFSGIQDAIKSFESHLPAFMQVSSASTSGSK
jgi:hypothetical protein